MHSLIDHFIVYRVIPVNDAIAQANGQPERLNMFDELRMQPGKTCTCLAQNLKLALYRRAAHLVSQVLGQGPARDKL